MYEQFLTFLQISLNMAVVIALLMAAVPLLKKHYRARWRTVAWLIIALRLIFPVNIPMIQLDLPVMPEKSAVEQMQTQPEEAPVRPQMPAVSENEGAPAVNVRPETQQGAAVSPVIPQENREETGGLSAFFQVLSARIKALSWKTLLIGIWAIGALITAILRASAYIEMTRHKKNATLVTNGRVLLILNEIKKEASFKGKLVLLCNPDLPSPMVFGLRRPVLMLPSEEYPDDTLRMVFRHELVHIMRRDLWYKMVLMVASTIHWFNPMVHWMIRAADRDLEFACDETVTARKNQEFRNRYSQAIMEVLQRGVRQRYLFSTGFCDTKKTLMQRFSAIFDRSKKHRGTLSMALLLTAVLLSVLVGCQVVEKSSSQEDDPASSISQEDLTAAVPMEDQQAIFEIVDLHERYANGKDIGEDFPASNTISLGHGFMRENKLLDQYYRGDFDIVTVPKTDEEALVRLFYQHVEEEHADAELVTNYSIDYYDSERNYDLILDRCSENSNGTVTMKYRRVAKDGRELYGVQYVLRRQTAENVPEFASSVLQNGDEIWQIVEVTRQIDTLPAVKEEVVEISTPEELIAAANRINEGRYEDMFNIYKLTADIDMEGYEMPMIGTNQMALEFWEEYRDSRDPYYQGFSGVFDGQGHTISNLTFDEEYALELTKTPIPVFENDVRYLGGVALFWHINQMGQVCNLTLENAGVLAPMQILYPEEGNTGVQIYPSAALMAVSCSGSIKNCHVSGHVQGTAQVGGMVGYLSGYASDSTTNADVVGGGNVGGFAGVMADGSQAVNCASTGSASVEDIKSFSSTGDLPSNIGGFVGHGVGETIGCGASSYVNTYVTAKCVGGFGGLMEGVYLEDCTVSGEKLGGWEPVGDLHRAEGDGYVSVTGKNHLPILFKLGQNGETKEMESGSKIGSWILSEIRDFDGDHIEGAVFVSNLTVACTVTRDEMVPGTAYIFTVSEEDRDKFPVFELDTREAVTFSADNIDALGALEDLERGETWTCTVKVYEYTYNYLAMSVYSGAKISEIEVLSK